MRKILFPRHFSVLVSFFFCFGLASSIAQTNPPENQAPENHVLSSDASAAAHMDKATSAPDTPTDLRAVPPDEAYRIGVSDELHVAVWNEPQLSGDVEVRPDGMITIPLVNDIRVVGLSTGQLKDLLTEKLKPYVTDPQVTIVVKAIMSRKIYLAGQVMRPGAFPLNGRRTVLQLLLEAGGLGPYAKTDKIYVLRNVDGKQERLSFNYKKALKGEDPKQNVFLMPGDMIVVP